MIRLRELQHHVVQFGTLIAILICPTADSLAQDAPQQVVARVQLKAPNNKEMPVFAEKGDLLAVVKIEDGKFLVQTSNDRRAWLSGDEVIPLSDAVPVFNELLLEDNKDPWLYVSRAMAYGARGEKSSEIADYNRAIDGGLKSPSVWVNRGVAYATSGQLDKAIADYDEAIRRGFEDSSVYMNRAVAYLSNNQPKQAAEDFSKVILKQPEDVFAHYQRAIAHQQLQMWDAAIADFSQVLKLQPKNVGALSSRGFTHYLKGDPAKAVDDFSVVIQLNPKSALAYNNRGYNRQMLGQYRQALADYDQAISLSPQYPLAWQNKAWLLATCPQEAIRDGKTALAAAQTAGQLREWKVLADLKSLAAAYAEIGEFEQAVRAQQKAVDMSEGDAKSAEQELLKLYQAGTPFRFAPPSTGERGPSGP